MSKQPGFDVHDARPGWYRVYNSVLDEYGERMGPYAIAVYSGLCRFASNDGRTCFPSHPTLARITGMSRRQVQREIDKLCKLGLISKEERYDEERQRSNIYTILDVRGGQTDVGGASHRRGGVVRVTHEQDLYEQDLYNNADSAESDNTQEEEAEGSIPPQGKGKKPVSRERDPWTDTLVPMLYDHSNFGMVTAAHWKHVHSVRSKLTKGGATPQTLAAWHADVWKKEWPGKTGQAPQPNQVVAGVAAYMEQRTPSAEQPEPLLVEEEEESWDA